MTQITDNPAMPFLLPQPDPGDDLANLGRLVAARWWVLAALAILALALPPVLEIALPTLPILAVLAIAAVFNGLATRRVARAEPAGPGELTAQIGLDIAGLAALIFFSGGATNPLVSLLLPPVAIAALTLPGRFVLAIGTLAVLAYSLLMVFYIPLPLADPVRAARLHLVGMWLTFAVSSGMIAWLVVRMTALIRLRNAQLAEAREASLRDERVVALGTLAAGAAHELGTPLATIAVIAGELDHESGLSAAGRDDLAVLRQQVGVCKEIITGLSRRAGVERLDAAATVPADRWLDGLRQRWHASRPQAASRFSAEGAGPAPEIVADPTLEQAVINLLNNAANAAPGEVTLAARWNATQLHIEVGDRGAGFPQQIIRHGGRRAFPAHPLGSGIGLILTRTAVERLGGRLSLENPPTGGALARIELPLPTP